MGIWYDRLEHFLVYKMNKKVLEAMDKVWTELPTRRLNFATFRKRRGNCTVGLAMRDYQQAFSYDLGVAAN